MKGLFAIAAISIGVCFYAQVGINTVTPNASLDINKHTVSLTDLNSVTSAKDGVIPPKLTKQELANKDAGTYAAAQNGALVFVTTVGTITAGNSINQVANIINPGVHYFDGTMWQPLLSTIPYVKGKFTTVAGAAVGMYGMRSVANPTPINLKGVIALPPGMWQVNLNLLLNIDDPAVKNFWAWCRFSFSEGTTEALALTSTVKSRDFNGASLISAPVLSPGSFSTATTTTSTSNSYDTISGSAVRPTYVYSMATGSIIINNTSSTTKYYSLLLISTETNSSSTAVGLRALGTSDAGENLITATKINLIQQ